eukprot:3085054-Rhodomonas_salina.2
MSGTEIAYGGTRYLGCRKAKARYKALSPYALAMRYPLDMDCCLIHQKLQVFATRCLVLAWAMLLRLVYIISVNEIRYAATLLLCDVWYSYRLCCYVFATQRPVLRSAMLVCLFVLGYAMLLRGCYTTSGTEIGYTTTSCSTSVSASVKMRLEIRYRPMTALREVQY